MISNQTKVGLGSTYTQAVQKETKQIQGKKTQQVLQNEETQQDRVSEIKSQIQDGTYKVDIQKTSEKMALNLLNL